MKKTMTLLFLLAVVAGFYALAVNAKGQGSEPTPTATVKPSPTMTPTEAAQVCTVTTGITSGAVNLRACPGAACGAVLDILTEGESLTILYTAGEYIRVRTESGAAGWLNSKYCKGK
jgi:SH3-like domain-containing protein